MYTMHTKDTIYKLAIKIFAKKGYESTSVDDIIRSCKIAKGTFYYHFQSKEDLFYHVLDEWVKRNTEIVEKNILGIEDPKKRMEVIIETHQNFIFKNQNLCRILVVELWCLKSKWKNNCYAKLDKYYFNVIRKTLKDGINKKVFDGQLDIDSVTYSIVSAMSLGTLSWAIFNNKKNKDLFIKNVKHIIIKSLLADQ